MINLAGIRKSATFANSSVPEGLFTAPFITLAPEPGSGGALIGQRVAKKLNYEYVDHQIIEEIAQSTKKRNKIIETIDEKARTSIEDLVHSHLNDLDDEAIVTDLVKVKGIGRWTAEMFLIFTLGRVDVFSPGDLGLKNAMIKLYGAEVLEKENLAKKLETWSPYRSYACLALWFSLDNR